MVQPGIIRHVFSSLIVATASILKAPTKVQSWVNTGCFRLRSLKWLAKILQTESLALLIKPEQIFSHFHSELM